MSWATKIIEQLKSGETVSFRPKGNSMSGRIESGQLVTVIPVTSETFLFADDIVLCTVGGKDYLHLIKAASDRKRYLICNNKGRNNGWTPRHKIYGKVVRIES